MMFTRKEHLTKLFLGNSEPREECLSVTYQYQSLPVFSISIPINISIHSKQHNIIEMSCPIPASKESRTTTFTVLNQGS